MSHDRVNWRICKRLGALTVAFIAVSFGHPDGAEVYAQSIMRSPNLNIGSRIPMGPRIDPNIAGRALLDRTTPRTDRPCNGYHNGECRDQPVSIVDDDSGSGVSAKKAKNSRRRNTVETAGNTRTIPNELVAEIDGALSDTRTDELVRRYGLVRIASQNFPLIGTTIGRFRITNRRPADTVSRELAKEAGFRSVQLNFRYVLQDQNAAATEGDPAQYALAKLRLPEAHRLARGSHVTVAVIDSGIDIGHPELANAIAGSFDALGGKQGPHVHGTGVAGAIVSHARLMGSAPDARILAIRAFGTSQSGAESNSFVILKALDYAVAHSAQIINMSFAGPKDALIERAVAAIAAKGVVMVAAAGNAGAKSPPLYPAANANVIAVSATDAQDRLFVASNRGSYIALAAPGVDIFLPAPEGQYQMTSGTSFSAAYISGLAALLLERNPALRGSDVRDILTQTARDLGAPGRDDLFGAGEADALAAVSAVGAAVSPAVASVPDPLAGNKISVATTLPRSKPRRNRSPPWRPESQRLAVATNPPRDRFRAGPPQSSEKLPAD